MPSPCDLRLCRVPARREPNAGGKVFRSFHLSLTSAYSNSVAQSLRLANHWGLRGRQHGQCGNCSCHIGRPNVLGKQDDTNEILSVALTVALGAQRTYALYQLCYSHLRLAEAPLLKTSSMRKRSDRYRMCSWKTTALRMQASRQKWQEGVDVRSERDPRSNSQHPNHAFPERAPERRDPDAQSRILKPAIRHWEDQSFVALRNVVLLRLGELQLGRVRVRPAGTSTNGRRDGCNFTDNSSFVDTFRSRFDDSGRMRLTTRTTQNAPAQLTLRFPAFFRTIPR